MNSQRKMPPPVKPSPRGVPPLVADRGEREPAKPQALRTEMKLDASQLTPRRRQRIDMQTGQQHLQILLPNKLSTSSKTFAEATGMTTSPRPKAAPRSSEIQELVQKLDGKKSDELNVPSGGRYGSGNRHRGGGDTLLRLPIEGMSKLDIKNELKHGTMPIHFGYGFDEDEDEDGNEEEEESNMDETNSSATNEDRARFNIWKGKNYELHMLGNFKSDFEKRVKSFQKPDMESIVLDPFCRSETELLDEPPNSNAFVIWKNKADLKWSSVGEKEPSLSSPFIGSSGDDDDDDDGDSLPDPELLEYILSQQQKREEGIDVTGETLYYDEDYDMVRNLHRDSYSLTNYGVMPDEKWIGKAHIFYPEMTEEEKRMLRVPEKKKISPRIAVVRRTK